MAKKSQLPRSFNHQQALVIGLGQFGVSLARSLTRRGVEVMAVDVKMERVDAISDEVADAICMDAADEASLAKTAPGRRDVSICAIGDDSRENSIIVTALLKQMGAPHIIARATDPVHERILTLVGAHEVLNPERAFGERLAARLSSQNVLDEIPLGTGLVVSDIRPPAYVVGRTLAELALPRSHKMTVVAIRRPTETGVTTHLPDPMVPIGPDEILTVVAAPGVASAFASSGKS
ncbi:MAG: TrkA family potassium uptake protein [Myxococcales bacterium]|nr:TrkA family potassium uptake protein [Myxococcales bacterium]